MDHLISLMQHLSDLNYEVNTLMRNFDGTISTSFLEDAERGMPEDKVDFPTEDAAELFEKRKKAFALSNRIVLLIRELNDSEKIELGRLVHDQQQRMAIEYVTKNGEYQKLIDEITDPYFSFEGKEEYKQRIIDLKDQMNKAKAASIYFDNMYAYLKPQVAVRQNRR